MAGGVLLVILLYAFPQSLRWRITMSFEGYNGQELLQFAEKIGEIRGLANHPPGL